MIQVVIQYDFRFFINFIAEISSNHNKDLNRTLRLIDSAKKNGFSSVKFQLFKINELFSKEILEI